MKYNKISIICVLAVLIISTASVMATTDYRSQSYITGAKAALENNPCPKGQALIRTSLQPEGTCSYVGDSRQEKILKALKRENKNTPPTEATNTPPTPPPTVVEEPTPEPVCVTFYKNNVCLRQDRFGDLPFFPWKCTERNTYTIRVCGTDQENPIRPDFTCTDWDFLEIQPELYYTGTLVRSCGFNN